MMGRALLVVGWLATLGLVAAAAVGWVSARPGAVGLHLLIALAACLLLLFSHSWIMFYLIGTGKAVKEAVAEQGLDPGLVERTRELKNRCYPLLTAAMGMAIVTFVLGGGVATGLLPVWTHSLLFVVTLAVQLRALLREGRVLAANERLLAEVDRLLRGISDSPVL